MLVHANAVLLWEWEEEVKVQLRLLNHSSHSHSRRHHNHASYHQRIHGPARIWDHHLQTIPHSVVAHCKTQHMQKQWHEVHRFSSAK